MSEGVKPDRKRPYLAYGAAAILAGSVAIVAIGSRVFGWSDKAEPQRDSNGSIIKKTYKLGVECSKHAKVVLLDAGGGTYSDVSHGIFGSTLTPGSSTYDIACSRGSYAPKSYGQIEGDKSKGPWTGEVD